METYLTEIEVDVSSGLPTVVIVGLPDTAVRESKDRVKSAIKNSRFEYPVSRITVNLAPADVRKEGPSFDLPIALGILAATSQIKEGSLKEYIILGELALDGSVRTTRGALPIALSMKGSHIKKFILPEENASEAAIVEDIEVYPVQTLAQAIAFINGGSSIPRHRVNPEDMFKGASNYDIDFSEVKGQEHAKRALEIAAAGYHNLLMIGPPGSGKSMLAKRLLTILPDITLEEALETTKIYSVAGLLSSKESLVTNRPFRNSHHTASDISIVGGGTIPRPGEVSLAHNGVLFFDELPEFHRDTLEALRQPLEDGYVTISRISKSLRFPSRFLFIATMNPCPCGFFGSSKECHCNPYQIQKYREKISGPLLDRIDIHIEVPALKYRELTGKDDGESSKDIKERVEKSRDFQIQRFKDTGIYFNSRMNHRMIKKFCSLNDETKNLLKAAIDELGISARAYDKVLKVARTIADLAGSESIREEDVSEAIQYRTLDRNLLF
jgi:magnesium chelatase family protein